MRKLAFITRLVVMLLITSCAVAPEITVESNEEKIQIVQGNSLGILREIDVYPIWNSENPDKIFFEILVDNKKIKAFTLNYDKESATLTALDKNFTKNSAFTVLLKTKKTFVTDFATFENFSKAKKFSVTIKTTDLHNKAIWSITSKTHNIVPIGKVKEVAKQAMQDMLAKISEYRK